MESWLQAIPCLQSFQRKKAWDTLRLFFCVAWTSNAKNTHKTKHHRNRIANVSCFTIIPCPFTSLSKGRNPQNPIWTISECNGTNNWIIIQLANLQKSGIFQEFWIRISQSQTYFIWAGFDPKIQPLNPPWLSVWFIRLVIVSSFNELIQNHWPCAILEVIILSQAN